MLPSEHSGRGLIKQICPLQHLQNHYKGSGSTPGPSARHLQPRLLQLAPGSTRCLHDLNFAAYQERGLPPSGRPTQILPWDPPIPWPPMAPCSSLHHTQDDGPSIQGGQWNWSCLPSSVGKTTHPSSSSPLNYFSLTPCTSTNMSKQGSIIKVKTLVWHRSVKRAPCRCQDPRVAHQLSQKTRNSLVQSSFRLCIASL